MPADSSKPDFWDTRFQDGVTPWDAGGELAGFFYLDDNPRGPPFGTRGISWQASSALTSC